MFQSSLSSVGLVAENWPLVIECLVDESCAGGAGRKLQSVHNIEQKVGKLIQSFNASQSV